MFCFIPYPALMCVSIMPNNEFFYLHSPTKSFLQFHPIHYVLLHSKLQNVGVLCYETIQNNVQAIKKGSLFFILKKCGL